MDASFESRVWQKALDRGWLSTRQVNDCLKEHDSTAATLRLTEILVGKGFLRPEQVDALRGELALAEPEAPEEVRTAARDPRRLIGRFVTLEELGRGGMGIVFRAWDGDLRRFVALKVLSGPWEEEDLARFRREAQSAAGLRHPNIIAVYEISPSDETPYIALELIQGKTLHGRKLPPRKAAELMVLIARAVEAAHRKGIIHRDLKPGNIMLDAEARPRVMDFGLAKPVLSGSKITMSGTVMGTPAYMSPEQARGLDRLVDQRSDVFSLGATLYELLTGRAPFGGKTPLDTLTAVVEHPPAPLRALAPSTPKPLEAIILTCLQKEKTRRYDSAEELALDLERFLRGEDVQARMPRSPGLRTFLLAGGIALAAGFALLAWPSPPPPPPAPPPPAPPPLARPKPVDRRALDEGLQLLERARLDLYRPNTDLGRMTETLKQAESRFDEALKADPAWGEALLARGQARQGLLHLDAALEDYAEALRRLPSSPAACLAHGRLLLERFYDEVLTAGWTEQTLPEELRQGRRRAAEEFLKARSLGVSEGDLSYLDACIAFAEGNYERAADCITRGLPAAARPEEFLVLRGNAALLLAVRGKDRAETQKHLLQSVDDFTQAVRLRVNYVEALRRRAGSLWFLQRAPEAFSDIQTVLRLTPGNSQALSDLATFYQRSGQIEPALQNYERAIAADPRNFRAFGNRASIRLGQDRPADAARDADQALKIRPDYVTAGVNRAIASYRLGDTPDALRRLDDILARSPRFAGARASRAAIYLEGGRWKEALADYELVVAEMPGDAERYRPQMDACRARLAR
jgi:tetratricopeptide (TPR) repeat protein